jgi:hypothetical protein
MKNRVYEYKRCAGGARKWLGSKKMYGSIDNQIKEY